MPGSAPLLRSPDAGPGAPNPFGSGAHDPAGRPPPAEPAIRAPWPAVALAAAFLFGYAAQHLAGPPLAVAERLGFRPALLAQGGWTGLVTALFIHGGWMHAVFNALAALAFGAPVARRLGPQAVGAAAFFVLFVATGVLGSLGFALLHPRDGSVLIGASGGVAGLMGAASRMIPPAGARLLPLTSRPVLTMAGAWLAVNLVFAVVGFSIGTGGAPLAWEAHLVGYAAGLLAIGPLLGFLRRAPGAVDSPPR